eukprot:4277969-Karenia_brevis.AAC.1
MEHDMVVQLDICDALSFTTRCVLTLSLHCTSGVFHVLGLVPSKLDDAVGHGWAKCRNFLTALTLQ